MNALSWLLYLIYFLGALKTTLVVFTIIVMVIFGFSILALVILLEERPEESTLAFLRKCRNYSFTSFFALVVLFTIIPNQSTVKLIAASEVSYYLVQTEAGQKVINQMSDAAGKTGEIMNNSLELLNQYIKEELTATVKDQAKVAVETAKEAIK